MTGQVKDARTGEPLWSAHVVHLGPDGSVVGGTTSGLLGEFSYDPGTDAPSTIRVSYVGYAPQVFVNVARGAWLPVQLEPVAVGLPEVEIFGESGGGRDTGAAIAAGLLLLALLALGDD